MGLSLAIPAGLLALILRHDDSGASSTAADGPVVTTRKAKVGSAAPDFTLTGVDGRRVRLSSLRGRVVVLTFFASWCHPCAQEAPVFEAAYGEVTGSKKIRHRVPVEEYLKLQKRYAHLFGRNPRPDIVERLQAQADRNIERFGLLDG